MRDARILTVLITGLVWLGATARAEGATVGLGLTGGPPADPPASADAPQADAKAALESARVTCSAPLGGREHCPADTTGGVALVRSTGEAPCLLGKTWGYDDTGIWVADGCGGVFLAGRPVQQAALQTRERPPEHVPNIGFLLYDGEKGQVYFRLFSYARYLNQKGLDPTYTDYFGNTHEVKQREDFQLNKFFSPFSGWFLTPRFRYYLYVWSSNPSQGDPAQVVGAGNLTYTLSRYASVGVGITSLPTVRSTEGQFPYWLGVDDRLIADEFFRGSYTTGIWVKGELPARLKYMAMLANNLSTLGVSAAQLDNGVDTQSFMLQWLPSTGEFGLWGTFGDYDWHEKVATRLGVHFTHSREDRQAQPGTNSIENSQIRLTDGSVVFTPDLFGAGITVDRVTYAMSSLDAGIKWHGLSLEAEYYWRWLSNFDGSNTAGIADIDDHGFQVQVSAMVVPNVLQVYGGTSQILGHYGDASEVRAGANWYILEQRGLRVNVEWLHLSKCPVGYTAVPYPVGGNGDVFHANLEMNF
jgi:hypothetical protein